ncbi:hypothetical protein LTR95_008309 [Oleoguttula sp. CCFEE 5521]
MPSLRAILLLPALLRTAFAATADEWRSRSIYQVMTDRFALANGTTPILCNQADGYYCGGQWRGIHDQLDYIQGMGFDAIWISPIVAQMPQWTADGMSYAGYWQQNLYDINVAFGNSTHLHDLIDAVHARGMFFMLDIVVNHMAWNGHPDDIQYKILQPFSDQKYYHKYCPSGYSDDDLDNLEECWLGSPEVPLADLDTGDPIVRQLFSMWIKTQVWKWGVDGLRIDAGINVEPDFFPDFMEAAGVFATAEVYTSHEDIMCTWTDKIGSSLNYPLYWKITEAFQSSDGDMSALGDMMKSERTACKDSSLLGTFSENHDVPRFANHTTDMSRAENVAAFIIMADGIPVAYQGSEQHLQGGTNPFTNREPLWETGYDRTAPIYKLYNTLNLVRRHAIRSDDGFTKYPSDIIHQDDHTIAMRKGNDGAQTITVLSNTGADSSDATVQLCQGHGFSSNTKLTEVLSCTSLVVDGSNCINVPVKSGQPQVLYAADALSGSTLCGDKSGDKVALTAVTISSTTITTTIGGQPTAIRTATTIPLSEITPTGVGAARSAAAPRAALPGRTDMLVGSTLMAALMTGFAATLIRCLG